jgi:hypothetical protein
VSTKSWREIAGLLADRLYPHTRCPVHPGHDGGYTCSFCEDWGAWHLWMVAERAESRARLLSAQEVVDHITALQAANHVFTEIPAATVETYPPGCGAEGCLHHYDSRGLPGCGCPAWFDGDGFHTLGINPQCTAHRVTVGSSAAANPWQRLKMGDGPEPRPVKEEEQ